MNIKNEDGRELEKWKEMKSIGKKRYILFNGVLKRILMSIATAFAAQAIEEGFSLDSFSNQNFKIRVIIFLVVFIIGGYIETFLSWRKYEKKYIND